MKKYIIAAVMFIFVCFSLTAYTKNSEIQAARDFLSEYGWETDEKICDSAKITVPDVFDNVYNNYNELQTAAGLDLEKYRGKSGTRYTFTVTNYPTDADETVYANVIVINSQPVGGDIMTRSLYGFMHSLSQNTPR